MTEWKTPELPDIPDPNFIVHTCTGYTPFFKNYSNTHSENVNLMNIANNFIVNNVVCYRINTTQRIKTFYDEIVVSQTNSVLQELYNSSEPLERDAMFLSCVDYDRYDLIEYFLNNGYNVNAKFTEGYHRYDIFVLIVKFCKQPITAYQMLKRCGYSIDASTYVFACIAQASDDVFDYFVYFDMPYAVRVNMFVMVTSHVELDSLTKIHRINILLQLGVNLNDFSQFTIDGIHCDMHIWQHLIDNGLQISNLLLGAACCRQNLSLIEHCLKNGISPTRDILKWVFDEMYFNVLKLFVKYRVNFSETPYDNSNNKFINNLMDLGLNHVAFTSYLLNYIKCMY